MAVGAPIAGTAGGANGAAVAPATLLGQGIVANDVVFLLAGFYASAGGTVPTAITWPSADANFPSGWTPVNEVATKNAAGTATGIAGWAWSRAAGSVGGGVSYSISANGTTGANSSSLGQIFKIGGCVTSGNPYEDAQVNNPNYTSTVDWPAASMNRSTGGTSVIMLWNTDNVNIGNPASWTALVSNATTQGLDSGLDVDYRQPGATGTYDPANGTMGANNNLGWAAYHVIFTDTAAATGSLIWQPAPSSNYLR